MPSRIKEEDAQAPFWLLTMGDMNNLLMCFFIMLVSFMIVDKSKYLKLQEDMEAMGGRGSMPEVGGSRLSPTDLYAMALKAMQLDPAARTEHPRVEGHYYELLQKIEEGTMLTLGGEGKSFRQGDWRLVPAQVEMLVKAKKFLAPLRNVVEIRGHTASNVEDSVVVEPDGRVRAYGPADREAADWLARADFMRLSYLRADEVRKFLVEAHPDLGDPDKIDERRIRLRADGYTRTVADSSNPLDRLHNRRIEVLATSELKEK